MENTPLGQAYDHAGNAVTLREKGSLNAARESHEQAAGSFAQAAQSTHDFEAVRILSLLEEHHKQLAKALASARSTNSKRWQRESGEKEHGNEEREEESSAAAAGVKQKNSKESEKTPAHNAKTNPALATLSSRKPRRDLTSTSSIANNLATARGKPANSSQRRAAPLPPDVTAHNAPGSIVASRAGDRTTAGAGARSDRTSSTTPSSRTRPTSPPTNTVSSAVAGRVPENFKSWYSSISGLYNKLPSSLAFAGLPLTIETEEQPESRTTPGTSSNATSSTILARQNQSKRASDRATAVPDLAHHFSPATLRALREDVAAGGNFAPHESFYVVPTSGGTRSYAGIVSNSNSGAAGDDAAAAAGSASTTAGGGTLLDDDDEFVDARENLSLGPPSPRSLRSSRHATAAGGKTSAAAAAAARHAKARGGKTMEELELENTALRQLLDTQSRRLQMWEASAQSQSMALAASMRLGRASSKAPSTSANTTGDGSGGADAALEEELTAERARREAAEHKLEKAEREREKALAAWGKYRDKFASLKESARQREREKAARAAAGEGGS